MFGEYSIGDLGAKTIRFGLPIDGNVDPDAAGLG